MVDRLAGAVHELELAAQNDELRERLQQSSARRRWTLWERAFAVTLMLTSVGSFMVSVLAVAKPG